MLLYDTLYVISTYSRQKTLFKGGTMISRVYISEPLRFSWDLDFEGKRMRSLDDVNNLISEINKELRANGGVIDMKIGSHKFSLGLFEVDKEKYVPTKFPTLIPIKRTLPALTVGSELPAYLRKAGLSLQAQGVTSGLIEIRKSFGKMLRVDDIRAEISVGGISYKEKVASIKSLLEPEKQPIRRVTNQLVSILEEVLADKIDSISKPITPEKTVDLVKDIFDISYLFKNKYESNLVDARLEIFIEKREDVSSLKDLYTQAKENIEEMKKRGASIFYGHHLFEPTQNGVKWEDLCAQAIKELIKCAKIVK